MGKDNVPILPYYYGAEADQFTFYRIPKVLFTSPIYSGMSAEAKILYGLMLDRMQLSIRNNWLDKENRVFIYYTVENIMADLGCANQKSIKLLAELEKQYGLIERKRQGLGKPTIIYVKNFMSSMPKSHFKTCENHISGDVKTTSLEVLKSQSNNTEINNTEFNDNNLIYSGDGTENDVENTVSNQYEQYEEYFRERICYPSLLQEYPYDQEVLYEILELLVETVCTKRQTIRIAGDDKPADIVKSRFMKLNEEHIRYMMGCMKENTTKVRNIKQYLLTTLYNAPMTMSNYYSALVNHDLYGV